MNIKTEENWNEEEGKIKTGAAGDRTRGELRVSA